MTATDLLERHGDAPVAVEPKVDDVVVRIDSAGAGRGDAGRKEHLLVGAGGT